MPEQPITWTPERIGRVLAMCAKATREPWHRCKASHRGGFTFGENEIIAPYIGKVIVGWDGFNDSAIPKYQHRANARFIAAARTGYPALLYAHLDLQRQLGEAQERERRLREALLAAEAVCLQASKDCPQWASYLSEAARQCTQALKEVSHD